MYGDSVVDASVCCLIPSVWFFSQVRVREDREKATGNCARGKPEG